MLQSFQSFATAFSEAAWGPWLLVLLLGGGVFFLVYSRFLPFRHLGHAWGLIRGRYDEAGDPGQVSHARALAAALSGTIGMGNIGGVALAIAIGGPGAIFWMWMTAILGIATKFFTCTLAIMYRGRDHSGELQGGPMYVIREGLPGRWHVLAYWFAAVGMIGCLPAFQTNQLVQIIRDVVLIDQGLLSAEGSHFSFNLTAGLVLAGLTAVVIFGGIRRIAGVAIAVVPFMALLYLGAGLIALFQNLDALPAIFALIVRDAFTGEAASGGILLAVILYGVQRGAYSNEAGIGTESLAHGSAKTREPVREGLVAMLGPIVDTLLICSVTAFMILLSGTWQAGDVNGVSLTAAAFEDLLGAPGLAIIFIAVLCFATTTILTYSFYGSQCAAFLFGAAGQSAYRWLYVGFIVVSAVISLNTAIGLIDGCFALMAIPTTVSALVLAPRVMQEARRYFATQRAPGPG